MNITVRWEKVEARAAWEAAESNWAKKDKNSGKQFSQSVSDFSSRPQYVFCQNLRDSNGCTDIAQVCKDYDSSGGYFIVQSFMLFESALVSIYDAVWSGADAVNQTALLDTFAPLQGDTMEVPKIVLDVVSILFSIGVAPMWNKILKRKGPWSEKERHDSLGITKDTTNALVTQSITLLKDSSSASGTQLANQETIQARMNSLAISWQESIDSTAFQLFNGSHSSISTLWDYMADGELMAIDEVPSASQLQGDVEKALYAYVIPEAWSLGESGPFVLDAEVDCVDGKPDISKDYERQWLDEDRATDSYYCYKSRGYYLVSARREKGQSCNILNPGDCTYSSFYPLYGVETMDGRTDKWQGITPRNIINGSLNSYFANNKKNGGYTPRLSDSAAIEELVANRLTSPGVFNLPVCKALEAAYNWYFYSEGTGRKTDNYPCN
ncbi:uncharacterized protein N7459_008711 [Penicillium hispanicum]|uniref:uncharacterized protein n=1 Tax=Penicillium hispanicum TaxID=1080232 RepID=UPI0025416B65|nr:uncharacterized protein N7459_008711 [Penicillium hispanicum]KAJ5574284.1 hypothetical protein N7459_008711 [Penicillium hispanicum]